MKKRRAKPAPVPGPRQRLSASRQRQRLIDACISALHLYGPSQTTVEKVVAIAKLSPGIVRFYFKSKGAMLVASLRFLSAEFEAQVLEPVAGCAIRRCWPCNKWSSCIWIRPSPAPARYRSGTHSGARPPRARNTRKSAARRTIASPRWCLSWFAHDRGEPSSAISNADAVALGLIGALEVLWQGIAFQTEGDVDRAGARRRCMAYLASVFPGSFPATGPTNWSRLARRSAPCAWSASAVLPAPGSWWASCRKFHRDGRLSDRWSSRRSARWYCATGREIRAFHNNCPHQPHALAKQRRGHFPGPSSPARCTSSILRCRAAAAIRTMIRAWHAWT